MPTKNVQINTGKDIKLVILAFLRNSLKHLLPMQETWVRSLCWEDPLEKEMVTHSSILAWRIPWTEEPGRLQSTGSQRVGHDWATSLHFTYPHKCLCWVYIFLLFNKFFSLTTMGICLHVHSQIPLFSSTEKNLDSHLSLIFQSKHHSLKASIFST